MKIVSMDTTDRDVLRLFSEHDDFMLAFLGDDRQYYTRYGTHEQLGRVWVAYSDNVPPRRIWNRASAGALYPDGEKAEYPVNKQADAFVHLPVLPQQRVACFFSRTVI